jgi:hemerythrin-like domain-containing protein
MKITDALLGEHGVFYAQFDHLDQLVPAVERVADIRTQAALLGAALATHANIEEELLFKSLDPHPEAAGPLNVMRREHQVVEGTLGQIPTVAELDQSKELFLDLIEVARQHFAKEERILFHMASSLLGEAKLGELGSNWAKRRKVTV